MCGHSTQTILEFGGADTRAAAAYPPLLGTAYAKIVARWASSRIPTELALQEVHAVSEERVHKHTARGATTESAKEKDRAEDEACRAGMRNPAKAIERWPKLLRGMARIGTELRKLKLHEDEFKSLSQACGDSSVRRPPPAEAVATARRTLIDSLGLDFDPEAHHPASPSRYELSSKSKSWWRTRMSRWPSGFEKARPWG